MPSTKVTTLGFVFTHEMGSCELAKVFYSDKPLVYVIRNNPFSIMTGDLEAVIKTGHVSSKKGKKIVLTAYEQEFLAKYKPVFEALEKIDSEKLLNHILEGE
jgi:hypothetical protein